ESIHRGLEMDPEERRARMRRMRQFVREHNVYRWAGTLITDLADMRLEMARVRTLPIYSPNGIASLPPLLARDPSRCSSTSTAHLRRSGATRETSCPLSVCGRFCVTSPPAATWSAS